MRLRKQEQRDAAALAEILVEGWRWAYKGIIPDDELASLDVGARMRSLEEKFDPDVFGLVAVDEENIAFGFAREARPPQLAIANCEIGALYVHPRWSRQGAGRALVAGMVDEFLSRGSDSMAIHTLVQNRIGRSFYQGLDGSEAHQDMWRTYPAIWYLWTDLPSLRANLSLS